MKLPCIVVLGAAALLSAQNPPAKGKAPAKAETPAAKPAAGSHPTLADLRRDFQERKLAALEAYVVKNDKATDAVEAMVEACGIAKELGNATSITNLTTRCAAAGTDKLVKDVTGSAGDDVNQFVNAITTVADMLMEGGKKEQAVELLGKAGEAKSDVRGLKGHLDGIAANYEKIGTEPQAIGKEDTAGKAIDLAEYKGKVVLLDFWATWCGPCVAELPNVLAAYEKHHDKGFEIVGISLDKGRPELDKFIADKKMPWRQYFDGKHWQNEVAVAWGIKSIPATYLIDQDGKIAAIGLRGKLLEQKVAALLAKSAAKAPAKK